MLLLSLGLFSAGNLTGSAHFWDASFTEYLYTQFQLCSVLPQKCFSCLLSRTLGPPTSLSPTAISKWMEAPTSTWTRKFHQFGTINESDLYTLARTQSSRAESVHENSIETLIIWKSLRNCVLHVTFLLFSRLFLLHTKHALIVGCRCCRFSSSKCEMLWILWRQDEVNWLLRGEPKRR